MNEALACVVALSIGGVLTVLLARRLDDRERRWAWMSFAAHVMSAMGQVLLVYHWYSKGDMSTFIQCATPIAEVIRADPAQWFWPYIRFGLHAEGVRIPYVPPGNTGATATMFVVGALHQLVFGATRFGMPMRRY